MGVATGVRVRRSIGVTFKSDRGHGDDRTLCKPFFQVLILGLAISKPLPPTIVVDHDFDMIRIIERRRTAIERGIIEVPFRRSELPNELRKIVAVFCISFLAALSRKVKLIPPLQLSSGRQRGPPRFGAADQIAA